MIEITTEVYGQNPPRFNMAGQSLPTQLFLTEEGITQGLAKRLYKYALETLDSSGFKEAVANWDVTVYTIEAAEKPSDRAYCVKWENEQGGSIEVVGILTRKGWPNLDHGLAIDR